MKYLLLPIALLVIKSTVSHANYWHERQSIIEAEESMFLGSNITLTNQEHIANALLMKYKYAEVDEGFRDPLIFLPSRHFFLAKKRIEKSKVFQIIKALPKGALLHSHDTSLLSEDGVFQFTYTDNLYLCFLNGWGRDLRFRFFKSPAAALKHKQCSWSLVKNLRKQHVDFDDFLRSQLTLVVSNPKKVYPDIDIVWKTFMGLFQTIEGLIAYKPVFEEYIYKVLEELYEDNVRYLEFRGYLPQVYDLDGNVYTNVEATGFYKGSVDRFKRDHPDWEGVRLIFAPSRRVGNATAERYVDNVMELKGAYPDFIAGFDLVGQEDLGRPLEDFVAEIKQLPADIKLFFHAGETNWFGLSTDFNLVDAVLLGSKRIGHGYAMFKHPIVEEMVKQRQIAIEICPISNQVLMLVDDVRNHPATALIAKGYNVVIANDDPSFWGAKALSYDWYMAYMGMTSREADIRVLKQLAMNSILYSAMPEDQKQAALRRWEVSWAKFVDELIQFHFTDNSINIL